MTQDTHDTHNWFATHLVRGSRRTQVFLAALMWTAVGTMLFSLGLHWIVSHDGDIGLLYAAPFVALGLLKAFFVLDHMTEKAVARIAGRSDHSLLIGFFSPRSWALVAGMMLTGQVLRATPLPRPWLGMLYVAVGAALVVSSRNLWKVWWRHREAECVPTAAEQAPAPTD